MSFVLTIFSLVFNPVVALAKPPSLLDYSLPKKFDEILCDAVKKAMLSPKEIFEGAGSMDPSFTKEDAKFLLKLNAEAKRRWKTKDIKISCLPGPDLKFKYEIIGESPVALDLSFKNSQWVLSWDDKSYSWDQKLTFQQNYENFKRLALKGDRKSARLSLLLQEVYAAGPLLPALFGTSLVFGAVYSVYNYVNGGVVCYQYKRYLQGLTDVQATVDCAGNTEKSAIQDRIRSLMQSEEYLVDLMKCERGPAGELEAKFFNSLGKEVVRFGQIREDPLTLALAYNYLKKSTKEGEPLLVTMVEKKDKPWVVDGAPKSWANTIVKSDSIKEVSKIQFFAYSAYDMMIFAKEKCSSPSADVKWFDAKEAAKSYNQLMLLNANPSKALIIHGGLREYPRSGRGEATGRDTEVEYEKGSQ